jgi:molecular chaperone GrpE (heat shock protein)
MHIEDETIDDNTVVEELMKGYIYNDSRVVRHSMVKVAN